ncbi:MAG: c-type cytochrome, partial [Verrucomicrobiota bacterium]
RVTLAGRKDLKTPEGWDRARTILQDRPYFDLADELSLILNREARIAELEDLARNGNNQALSDLAAADAPGVGDFLLASLDNDNMRQTALHGLAKVNHGKAAERILTLYPKLTAEEQQDAVRVLTKSKKNAALLLTAMASDEIPRSALTAYQARQIQDMKDDALKKQLKAVWGDLKSSNGEKRAQIKSYQDQLLPDILAKANLSKGKELYTQRCFACHVLHGEGGKIGPELTGANRGDVYYLLENIIDPSATLPKDFHVTVVTKKDDQVVTGNIVKKTDYTLTLTTPEGDVIVQRDEIKDENTMPVSLMPEGLLNGLEFDQVRDLVGYLMSEGS